MAYIGRFAPSPTGSLHLGSLVAALGSYLDARSNQGIWLVRMEDLDPPREISAAKTLIPWQLEQHGLYWDQSIELQSNRQEIYQRYVRKLIETGLCFYCSCSRQRIKALGGNYDGLCRPNNSLNNKHSDLELSLRIQLNQNQHWQDFVQGAQNFTPEQLHGDFVIQRRDGLFSYQLAVAIDDSLQNISRVIRGADLLDSTARQIYLQNLLGLKSPEYGHLPIVINSNGQKLSKQNLATSLDETPASKNLFMALQILGQHPLNELLDAKTDEILLWATQNWNLSKVPKQAQAV